DDRIQRSPARALQGDARGQRRQPGRQRGLASQVPVRGVLDHRAHRDFAQLPPLQAVALDQRPERAHRHAEVADVGIGRVAAAERNADAAEHGDGTTLEHRYLARPARRRGHNAVSLARPTWMTNHGSHSSDAAPADPRVLAALALELTPGSPVARDALAQQAAGRLGALVARDLGKLQPAAASLDLALVAAHYDPVELLRPGWPLHHELDQLAARAPRGDGSGGRVIAFGAHDGKLPAGLSPSPDYAGGPLRLLPFVLLGADAVLEEVGEA